MAELSDIQNEEIRYEISEFLERPDEIERFVGLFAAMKPILFPPNRFDKSLVEGFQFQTTALLN